MNRRERRAHGAVHHPRVRISPRGFRLMFPGLTAPVDFHGTPIKPGQAELSMWHHNRSRGGMREIILEPGGRVELVEDSPSGDAFAREFVAQPAA